MLMDTQEEITASWQLYDWSLAVVTEKWLDCQIGTDHERAVREEMLEMIRKPTIPGDRDFVKVVTPAGDVFAYWREDIWTKYDKEKMVYVFSGAPEQWRCL